jgi:hypothetical protein
MTPRSEMDAARAVLAGLAKEGLAILSLLQVATTPRLVGRSPKGLAVTHPGPNPVRHLHLLACKFKARTDGAHQPRNKRARNRRLLRLP